MRSRVRRPVSTDSAAASDKGTRAGISSGVGIGHVLPNTFTVRSREKYGSTYTVVLPSVMRHAAAPKCVAVKAEVARPPAARALPALKPNQPTQRRQAPMKLSTRLWGFIGSAG